MANLSFSKKFPEKTLIQLLHEARYNPNDPPPDEVVIWRIDGQNIGSLGNFALLTGLPKAGKGKYISGITAAALTRDDIFNQRIRLPEGKEAVRYYDTEQSKYDHFQMMELVKRLGNIETLPQNFAAFHCRKHDPQTIIPMIEYDLEKNPDIGLLILDGLLDLIDSFNDEAQSKRLVNFLKRITDVHNCFVLGVLHRSKSTNMTMGHLGSAADRASQSVLKVEKNRELKQYVLQAEYLRNADDFNPIAIYFNRNLGSWEQCDYIPGEGQDKKPSKLPDVKAKDLDLSFHTLNVLRIFNTEQLQGYEVLIQNIREIYGRGRNWAVDCVKHLTQDLNIVFKTPGGYTNVKQARLYVEK